MPQRALRRLPRQDRPCASICALAESARAAAGSSCSARGSRSRADAWRRSVASRAFIAVRASASTTASPIALVPMLRWPGWAMSPVRWPVGERRAHGAARSRRRDRRARTNSAASSPPTGSPPADWRCPCRRCRAPSRAPARTGPAAVAPSDADGSMPIEPVSIAAASDRMSPNMLPVTITSNCFGARISCIAAASTNRCVSSTSGYSLADARDDVAPELHRLEHVGLVDRAHLAPARARGAERDVRDALDLGLRVAHRVERLARAAGVGADAARLAEVDVAGQLAQDHEVEARRRPRASASRRPTSSGNRNAGRKLANRSRSLRSRSRPRPGACRTGIVSSPGTPAAPNRIASALRAISSVRGGSGSPARRCRRRRSAPRRARAARVARRRRAAPSPPAR